MSPLVWASCSQRARCLVGVGNRAKYINSITISWLVYDSAVQAHFILAGWEWGVGRTPWSGQTPNCVVGCSIFTLCSRNSQSYSIVNRCASAQKLCMVTGWMGGYELLDKQFAGCVGLCVGLSIVPTTNTANHQHLSVKLWTSVQKTRKVGASVYEGRRVWVTKWQKYTGGG